MGRRAIALVAVTVLAAACSLTSLDGFSGGGAAPPGTRDADATSDGTVTDARTSGDVTTDAASACASAPAGAFCEDFERGLSAWSNLAKPGNTIAIDDVASTSPTHSLLITTAVGGASCLSKAFPGSPQIIEVDADIRFEVQASSDYDFMELTGSDRHNLSIQVRQGLIELDQDIVPVVDGGPDDEISSTGFGVDSSWHHYHWTNHLTGSTADVELFVDGKKVIAAVMNVLDYERPVTLNIGDCSIYPQTGKPWKVRYDNIVVVAK